jgi:hypothetical protein
MQGDDRDAAKRLRDDSTEPLGELLIFTKMV